jgi:hypothetical protein
MYLKGFTSRYPDLLKMTEQKAWLLVAEGLKLLDQCPCGKRLLKQWEIESLRPGIFQAANRASRTRHKKHLALRTECWKNSA